MSTHRWGGEYDAIKGFVLLVLKASDTLGASLVNDESTLSAYVQDITDVDNHEDLYGTAIAPHKISYSQTIDVAGRAWRIDTVVTAADKQMKWIPWLVLTSGLIITLFSHSWSCSSDTASRAR